MIVIRDALIECEGGQRPTPPPNVYEDFKKVGHNAEVWLPLGHRAGLFK